VAREESDALICVDTVSSMAGVSIPVDELGIDYCVTSSQKCFSLPPGLAFASVSPRSLAKAAGVKNRGWYFDLLNLDQYAAKGHYPSTPALTLMYALARQLGRIFAEGLEERYRRHTEMARRVRGWAEEHLAFFAHEGYRSETLTTVANTLEIDFADLAAFLLEHGMTIANGYGDLKGRTFRIAHMGDMPLSQIDALLEVLTEYIKR
jgi:aspartate aminotransferase-like enzyme